MSVHSMPHRQILAAIAALAVAGCSSVPRPPVPVVQHVDLERFMGDWYVIASIPTYIERDAWNAIESYKLVWQIKADYRISYLSEDYGQTVIAREARDYVWIMARSPQLSEADYARLTDFVAAMGYDLSKLRKVPQRRPVPAQARGDKP